MEPWDEGHPPGDDYGVEDPYGNGELWPEDMWGAWIPIIPPTGEDAYSFFVVDRGKKNT